MFARTIAGAALAAGLLVSTAVLGEPPSSDVKYCGDLIATYQKYIVGTYDPDMSTHVRANLDTAVANCQAGNTAAGIPPLEKALRDAKFTLPPRG
jgi:hypothetical protein